MKKVRLLALTILLQGYNAYATDTHNFSECPSIPRNMLIGNNIFSQNFPVHQSHTNFAQGELTAPSGDIYTIKATSFLFNGATAQSVDSFLAPRNLYPLQSGNHNLTFNNTPITGAVPPVQGDCVYFASEPHYGYFYIVLNKRGGTFKEKLYKSQGSSSFGDINIQTQR